eukprot:TRINITY_DN6041_c0_g1_i3.p1 TRINITY_DN6041_c0_g1~~TRINITY_DN6041_c0_g1_i3.p1  ORF type:complete len:239 (-),score=55.32 TRINITY_DN6041_c0_g1_i3:221-937(-)
MWSLGCLVYTLLVGKPAFRGGSEYLTFQKVSAREFVFPAELPDVAKDFIDKLLVMAPADRLGSPQVGFGPLKAHPFFKSIDFLSIQKLSAPSVKVTTDSTSTPKSKIIVADDVKEPSRSSSPNTDKSKVDQNLRWRKFLLPDEEICQLGYVHKRRGLFSKRRMLILTNLPRFVYIDAAKMEKKGEITWSNSLRAELKSDSVFYIHTPNRSYYMQAEGSPGSKSWVDQINAMILGSGST